MKCFQIATITILLTGLSNAYLIPPTVTEKYIDPDIIETNPNKSNDTLIFAQVIFRHGDRNIVKQYPNDPYKDEVHWPEGYGQLTNVNKQCPFDKGKMRSYKLGQYFRRRYDKLLGDNYSPKKVYIQSTDVDRCLMTAETVLAALFYPTEAEKWNKEILWIPTPVHSVPTKLDHVLAAKRFCRKYELARENYTRNAPEIQRIYKDYANLFLQWSEMTGENISTIDDIYYLHNTIRIEIEQNKSLPNYVKKSIVGPMQSIAEFNFKLDTNTPLMARLKYGFLLKEIFEHFTRKIDGTLQPSRLLWLYSAHDFTISGLLNSLGLFELHILPYSCSLHFELYKTDQGEHYIQIFYRKSEKEYPVPMEIPLCGRKCSLKKFYELYKEILPGDFNAECY